MGGGADGEGASGGGVPAEEEGSDGGGRSGGGGKEGADDTGDEGGGSDGDVATAGGGDAGGDNGGVLDATPVKRSGLTTLPTLLDILLPSSPRIRPWWKSFLYARGFAGLPRRVKNGARTVHRVGAVQRVLHHRYRNPGFPSRLLSWGRRDDPN